MIIEQSPQAKDVVLKLSETMRYVLYNSNETYVPLKKELEYIDHYLAIQKIRLRNPQSIQVNYTIDQCSKELKIAPLLIIVFIENQDFAIESYEHEVCDYLLKPFSLERFIKSVNKACKIYQSQNSFHPKLAALLTKPPSLHLKL